MSGLDIVLAGIVAFLALAVLGAVAPRRGALVYGACAVVAAVLAGAALSALAGPVATLVLPLGLPWLGVNLALDPLSCWFLAIVDLGAAAAALYAIGYGREDYLHGPEPGRVVPFFPAFVAAMNLVPLAADAYSFLFGWESMSLASWALVVAQHRTPGNVRAGYVYLLMAGFGTLALLLAFGILGSGGFGFAAMRAAHPGPVLAGVVLVLALVGAGSKAGLAPLHVWLPLAHPAAPSHVSALMSAVMTKVAVYGFIRIVLDLLGPPEWWWALPVLLAGGLTAGLGVLQALMERDLKRLLAFSTIENIGIVFLALGLALAFRANGMAAAAALALTAGLFHAANHAMFKSVLFFGAGAVQHATGTRDIERMGGLLHRMPVTGWCFLLAAAAISALPPLNGFASEWLIFQAIFVSPALPQWGLKLLVPAMGTMLALAAALVAGCFVRGFGIAFLGRPRAPEAISAHEVDRFSLAAMLVPCALCVLAGLLPGIFIDALAPVAHALAGGAMPVQAGQPWQTVVPVADARGTYNGLLIALFLLLAGGLAALLSRRGGGGAPLRGPAWGCGFPAQGPRAQYTATSLAQPIRRVMGSVVLGTHETVDMPGPLETRPARIIRVIHDPAWETIIAPVVSGVAFVAGRLNHLQFLTIRRYLSLVFGVLVVLLVLLGILR